ncbi:hypothetical protein EUGRSUZ_F00085 [Eucalyptus grandis]|uniref:Uncharacterized protein n=2 Tax=Eucalyptus grandis TaxID=71139 RepID=A0A059BJ52_EUCGR|nr:hypothetical protein EUGRSUZ_F00085 [Eucalyptus grandis]
MKLISSSRSRMPTEGRVSWSTQFIGALNLSGNDVLDDRKLRDRLKIQWLSKIRPSEHACLEFLCPLYVNDQHRIREGQVLSLMCHKLRKEDRLLGNHGNSDVKGIFDE